MKDTGSTTNFVLQD